MTTSDKKNGGHSPPNDEKQPEIRKERGAIGGRRQKTERMPTRRGRVPVHSAAQEVLRDLGRRIKTIREEKGVSVAQLAGLTDIAPQTIIHFEDDGRPIRFLLMHRIAESLGYDLDFLLSKTAG